MVHGVRNALGISRRPLSLSLPLSLYLSMSVYPASPPSPPCMQSELLQVFQAFLQARVSNGDMHVLSYEPQKAGVLSEKHQLFFWLEKPEIFINLTPLTMLPAPQPQISAWKGGKLYSFGCKTWGKKWPLHAISSKDSLASGRHEADRESFSFTLLLIDAAE